MSFNILVVDDDMGFRRCLSRRLSEDGYNVLEAPNGEEALASCQERAFDAVLTDWEMPGMTGPELCEKLKQLPSPPAVIIMDGKHSEEEARRSQAELFVRKRYDTDYDKVVNFLDLLE